MNRTIKEATVKRFHYDDHDQLRNHLANFISAYNFGRRLKTLKGLTPYEFICKQWTIEPERFTLNPIHQMPGWNRYSRSSCPMAGASTGCSDGGWVAFVRHQLQWLCSARAMTGKARPDMAIDRPIGNL